MDGMTINHIVSIDHGSYIYIYTYTQLYTIDAIAPTRCDSENIDM